MDATVRLSRRTNSSGSLVSPKFPCLPTDFSPLILRSLLWNFAGKAGTCLVLDQPGDIRALDLTGRSIARQSDGSLSVPFGEDQVYLLSDALDVVAFNTLIQHARIEKSTPVSVFAQPLSKSVTVAQNVGVVLENHTTTSLTGSIFLSVTDASGGDQSGSAATFTVESGRVGSGQGGTGAVGSTDC